MVGGGGGEGNMKLVHIFWRLPFAPVCVVLDYNLSFYESRVLSCCRCSRNWRNLFV